MASLRTLGLVLWASRPALEAFFAVGVRSFVAIVSSDSCF